MKAYIKTDISVLTGKTLVSIKGMSNGNDEIYFLTSDGKEFVMYHDQDCCERVEIDDVCGVPEDLLNSPILKAEVTTSENTNPKSEEDLEYLELRAVTWTWTFYHFATAKGYVDIKWYGTSNGYYSESVDFAEITEENENKKN